MSIREDENTKTKEQDTVVEEQDTAVEEQDTEKKDEATFSNSIMYAQTEQEIEREEQVAVELKKRKKKLACICCGAIVGAVVIVGGIQLAYNHNLGSIITSSSKAVDNNKGIKSIEGIIKALYNNNAYIAAYTSEDKSSPMYIMYNNKKECYMEFGNSDKAVVYRKDHISVPLATPIEMSYDYDILASLSRGCEMVNKDKATLEQKDLGNVQQYNITISGTDIKDYFEDEEYSESMLEAMFGTKEVKETDYILLTVNLGENDEVGASFQYHIDGSNYINWWFDGYMEFCSWKLADDWYKLDSLSEEDAVEVMVAFKDDISKKINSYVEENKDYWDNGLDIESGDEYPTDVEQSDANSKSSNSDSTADFNSEMMGSLTDETIPDEGYLEETTSK